MEKNVKAKNIVKRDNCTLSKQNTKTVRWLALLSQSIDVIQLPNKL